MTKVHKRLGFKEDKRLFTPDNRLILPDCRIGIEQEWEGTGAVAANHTLPTTSWSHYWTWHQERSLRNEGSEFVFSEPLFGADVVKAIDGLAGLAIQQRWDATQRCGIHVHVDVRDLSMDQLVGFCLLYAIFEKPIYKWIGDNRENNHFCLPWYKAEGSVIQAATVMKAAVTEPPPLEGHRVDIDEDLPNRVDPLMFAAEEYERYAGLNLAALSRFGSIEARHLRTTANTTRIYNWINILLSLKRATYNIPTSDGALVSMIQNLGARTCAAELLDKNILALLDYPDFEADVQDNGVGIAEELAREGLTRNIWQLVELPVGKHKGFMTYLAKKKEQQSVPFPQPRVLGQEEELALPLAAGVAGLPGAAEFENQIRRVVRQRQLRGGPVLGRRNMVPPAIPVPNRVAPEGFQVPQEHPIRHADFIIEEDQP